MSVFWSATRSLGGFPNHLSAELDHAHFNPNSATLLLNPFMSSSMLNEKQKHEIIFANHYKNISNKHTSDRSHPNWLHINRELAQNVKQLLKDPSIENLPLRNLIKERGFLLGGSDILCVCVEEKDGPVAMVIHCYTLIS